MNACPSVGRNANLIWGVTLVGGYTDIQDFFTDIHQIYNKHRYTPDIQPDIHINSTYIPLP